MNGTIAALTDRRQSPLNTLAQVGAAFGVSARQVAYWKAEGMPSGPAGKGPYDFEAIVTWLDQRAARTRSFGAAGRIARKVSPSPIDGTVEAQTSVDQKDFPPPRVVKTLVEIAKYFNVSVRQVGYWRADGMPSGPGSFGPYDLEAIDRWLSRREARVRGGGRISRRKRRQGGKRPKWI